MRAIDAAIIAASIPPATRVGDKYSEGFDDDIFSLFSCQ
jgi:hypothetical protein